MNHSSDCRIHDDASVCDCGVLAARDAGGCAPPVMVAPMPKDNEVDEKAENWDYCRDLRIAVTDGKNGARATLNGHGAPAGISLYHGDYVAELKTEAAASAATVAELRARADAAERRVGELEAFVTAVRTECFDYYNEGIRPWPHHMQTLAWKADEVLKHATLTGADPT